MGVFEVVVGDDWGLYCGVGIGCGDVVDCGVGEIDILVGGIECDVW